MPKGTAFCNSLVNLIYRAEAIANLADNAAASPITNIKMRLATASYVASDNGSANEATYTNYVPVDVPRSASGWTAGSGGATNNVADVPFAQCGASGNTITSAANTTGAGASMLLHYGDLNAPIAVSNQIQPRFPAGSITVTEA
jgi:hypothetical protein